MDVSDYEEIAGRLRGLLIRLGDRLRGEDQTWILDFIDANELGLALEQMADALGDELTPVSVEEREDMLSLADSMAVGDRVGRALALCPRP